MEALRRQRLRYALVVALTIHYVLLRYITISRQAATEVELAGAGSVGVVSTWLRNGGRSLRDLFACLITREHVLAAPAIHVVCGWWLKLKWCQLQLYGFNGGVRQVVE